MANSSWFNSIPLSSINLQCRSVVLNDTGVNDLAEEAIDIPTLTEAFFGDITKWSASLLYLPFYIQDLKAGQFLKTPYANYIQIMAGELDILTETGGYTLGEYYCASLRGTNISPSFLDYEPYSKLEVYLPYYGFAELKIADVLNKYIQFRLRVDFKTGQATYYIGVNESSVSQPNAPKWDMENDINTRIISTYVFQLGYNFPIGRTDAADNLRNMLSSAIKTAAIVGASYIAPALGAGISTTEVLTETTTAPSTTTQTVQGGKRTKKGGSPNIVSTTEGGAQSQTKHITTNTQSQFIAQRVNACFEGAGEALSNLGLRTQTDKPNNSFADGVGARQVKIIRKFSRLVPRDESFGKLYGFPVGEVRKLNTLSGYTEISNIHIEGEGFETATHTEIAMLNKLLSDGVIL